MSLDIVFAGTPEFSVPSLKVLLGSAHHVSCVLTQPDRQAGRGRKLKASPVKQQAESAGVTIYQPESLKTEEAQLRLAGLSPDLMVVIAYGLILPQAVLDIPRLGCINVHASILPRWRGAAPIQRSILAGDSETGVTIMQMNAGLDTGDMLSVQTCPISETETSAGLHDILSQLGAEALIEVVNRLEKGNITAEPQDDSQACYADKIDKAEAMIDWQQTAIQIDRQIRAFNPWPVAWTSFENKALRIWQASVVASTQSATPGTVITSNKRGIQVATGDGVINIEQLQLPGGKPMPAHSFINAHSINGYCFENQ